MVGIYVSASLPVLSHPPFDPHAHSPLKFDNLEKISHLEIDILSKLLSELPRQGLYYSDCFGL